MLVVALTHGPDGYDLPVNGEPFEWPQPPMAEEMRRTGYALIRFDIPPHDPRTHRVSGHLDTWDWGGAVLRTRTIVERPIEEVRHEAYAIIARSFENTAGEILYGYSPAERATWPAQIAEAMALLDNPNADASLLQAIALEGETKTDVAKKVITKAMEMQESAAPLLKYRRQLSAKIASATKVEEIAAVLDGMNWNF